MLSRDLNEVRLVKESLEAAEGEDLSGLKKGESIEYKYYIKDVTPEVTTN